MTKPFLHWTNQEIMGKTVVQNVLKCVHYIASFILFSLFFRKKDGLTDGLLNNLVR